MLKIFFQGGMCAVDLQLLLFLYCKNKYVELIFKLIMLIHVYFRHAELWHVHPVIQYKCTNINIKSAMKSAYTERESDPQSYRLVSLP